MKKLHLNLMVILSILFSIHTAAQNDSLIISGNLNGFEDDDQITLWVTNGNISQRANQYSINQGQFEIKYQLKETPNRIKLTATNTRKRMVLWAHNDSIKITGSKAHFDQSNILGAKFMASEKQFHSIYNRDTTIQEQVDMISQYLNTPSAVHHLSRLVRDIPIDTLTQLYHRLDLEWKAHDYGKKINNFIQTPQKKKLEIGDQFIDFKAIDSLGNEFVFSSKLNQNKLVLLEFSSYACPWCRKAIPIVNQIHQKYQDSIQIVSFIQDTRADIWKKYLTRFKSDWEQIWDGEGEIGQTFIAYGIKGSPNYFLISSSGKIIDKWFGLEEIEQFEQRIIKALKARE